MDKRLENIMENYDKMKIGVDEPFRFRCTMCGKCCIDRDDILLSPKDLYRIAKHLCLNPKDVVKKYCEVYIGSSSRLPIVRLKPQGAIKRCPLLNGKQCSVHKAKPTVCAMFPIGRCIKVETDATKTITSTSPIEYICVRPKCGDNRETHTVRDWLNSFDIPIEDEYFVKWQQTIDMLSTAINEMESKCEKGALNPVWDAVCAVIYINYDMDQEFMPQFEKNSTEIVHGIEMLLASLLASSKNE